MAGGPSQGTTVTVGFDTQGFDTVAAAVQVGAGPFIPVTVQNSVASFIVPQGTTKYSFAYVCQHPSNEPGQDSFTIEEIVQATTEDATSLQAPCQRGVTLGPPPPTGGTSPGSLTGTVDATAISGVGEIDIFEHQGRTQVLSNQGAFAFPLSPGPNDIAIVAVTGAFQEAAAVKIFRGQTVPGSLNGGNTITFGTSDQTTNQPLIFGNLPSGFAPLVAASGYETANGTIFPLVNDGQSLTQYPAVPAGVVQNGDFYIYEGFASGTVGGIRAETGVAQTTSTGGGPATLALPAPWLPSNPITTGPTGPPITFTFDYPGFSGMPVVAQQVELDWSDVDVSFEQIFSIAVITSPNFQNGSNTITVPDLSSLPPPFFDCCPTSGGTQSGISWTAGIYGATVPATALPPGPRFLVLNNDPFGVVPEPVSLPADASVAFVVVFGGFPAP